MLQGVLPGSHLCTARVPLLVENDAAQSLSASKPAPHASSQSALTAAVPAAPALPDVPCLQVVVVNQVLACNATLGYEVTFNTQVGRQPGCGQAWPGSTCQQALQVSQSAADPQLVCRACLRGCCLLRLCSPTPVV